MKLSHALRQYADIEERIGATYLCFARAWRRDPVLGPFWRRMAEEERAHALALLSAAERVPAHGRSGEIDPAAIAAIRGYVLAMTALAGRSSVVQAFRTALDLEGLELERIHARLLEVSGFVLDAGSSASDHEERLFTMIERVAEDPLLLREVAFRRADQERRAGGDPFWSALHRALPPLPAPASPARRG